MTTTHKACSGQTLFERVLVYLNMSPCFYVADGVYFCHECCVYDPKELRNPALGSHMGLQQPSERSLMLNDVCVSIFILSKSFSCSNGRTSSANSLMLRH